MYFLEKKSVDVDRDGKTRPAWKPIYYCPERWPLEALLKSMDPTTHRITSNNPSEG